MEQYDSRYYTLGRLSPSSLFLIKNRLKQFMKDYDVTDYPLDCFALLRKIQESEKINLCVKETNRLSSAFDATAVYLPKLDGYLIILKSVPTDWKRYSSWRRVNFTLAHELGHIFLGHLEIPRSMKNKEQESRENDEADEFAGRLLMPEKLLLHSHFSSHGSMSAAYLVSDQALYKRLNNLKRLDLFKSSFRPTCPVCGNDRISPIAEYCEICGAFLPAEGRNGVRTIEYTQAMTAEDGRVLFCPVCGNEEFSTGARFCRICGTPAYNFCGNTDVFVDCYHINSPNARFCELCGRQTVYSAKNLLQDWKEERNEYIRAITQ